MNHYLTIAALALGAIALLGINLYMRHGQMLCQ